MKVTDKRSTTKATNRQELIDADIARYGESYARISVNENGALEMEHLPRELVRPILVMKQDKPS